MVIVSLIIHKKTTLIRSTILSVRIRNVILTSNILSSYTRTKLILTCSEHDDHKVFLIVDAKKKKSYLFFFLKNLHLISPSMFYSLGYP